MTDAIECICPLICKLDQRCSHNSHSCFLCIRGKEKTFPTGQINAHVAIEHNEFRNSICAWGPRCNTIKFCNRIHICPICTKNGNFKNQFQKGAELKKHLFEKHTFQNVFTQINQKLDSIPLECWKNIFSEVMTANRILFSSCSNQFVPNYSKDYYSTIWRFPNRKSFNFVFQICDGSCILRGQYFCNNDYHKCVSCGVIFRTYDLLYEHIKDKHSIDEFSKNFPSILCKERHKDYETFIIMSKILIERYKLTTQYQLRQKINSIMKFM